MSTKGLIGAYSQDLNLGLSGNNLAQTSATWKLCPHTLRPYNTRNVLNMHIFSQKYSFTCMQ